MTIETVMRDYYVAFAVVASVALTMALWAVAMAARALFRWVAGRRKAPKACPVCGNHEVPVGFADWEPWNKPASSCDVRYTCRCCGAEVWHEVAHDGKRAGWRCAPCLPARTLEPAPDRQYQGDQVSGIRKELRALEERVGRMEAAHYSLDWIVAQQMRDPHFEPVGTQPVEGDIVYNPDKKRYSIVESVGDEVYLDDGGSYHCWAFMSPAVVPDDRFGGEQRPRVLRRNPQ